MAGPTNQLAQAKIWPIKPSYATPAVVVVNLMIHFAQALKFAVYLCEFEIGHP